MRRRQYLSVFAFACCVGGCTTAEDDGIDRSHVYENAMLGALESDGATVHDLTTAEDAVEVTYSPAEPTEQGVESSIQTGARAFYDRVYGGWDVERLDVSMLIADDLAATWYVESQWVQDHRDGRLTREEFADNVENSVERYGDVDDD